MKSRQRIPRGRARPRPSIAVSAPQGFLEFLKKKRIEPKALYSEALLDRIRSSPRNEEFPESTFIKMFGPAIRAIGQEDLILEAMFEGADLMFDSLIQVISQSSGSDEAVWQLVRYNHLTGSLGYFHAAIEEDQRVVIWWDAAEATSSQPNVMEYRMAMVAQGIRKVCQDNDMPMDVSLPFKPPSYAAEYEKRFKGEVKFSTDLARLVAPSRALDAPPLIFPVNGPRVLEQDIEPRTFSTDASQLHQMLAEFILENMASGNINLEHAARWLRVSGRTLQRWLDKTGIHYQELVDQIRLNEAKSLLSKPTMSLSRIAFQLGYSAQTNFQNAFRRWTGMAPGDYRRRLQDKGAEG